MGKRKRSNKRRSTQSLGANMVKDPFNNYMRTLVRVYYSPP